MSVCRVCWPIMPALSIAAARRRDPVEALFHLLEQPVAHRDVLARPLERLALAYLTQARQNGKLYDPVATFHLSNGARLRESTLSETCGRTGCKLLLE